MGFCDVLKVLKFNFSTTSEIFGSLWANFDHLRMSSNQLLNFSEQLRKTSRNVAQCLFFGVGVLLFLCDWDYLILLFFSNQNRVILLSVLWNKRVLWNKTNKKTVKKAQKLTFIGTRRSSCYGTGSHGSQAPWIHPIEYSETSTQYMFY